MKALTISQPWANMIADGEKFVENRCWPVSYRGPIAIHAGFGTQYLTKRELQAYPTGAIIAVANLVACVEYSRFVGMLAFRGEPINDRSSLRWKDVMDHRYTEGPYCWVLDSIRKLSKPIMVKGKQGLWNPSLEIVTELQKV